ncbi:hypothetical protein GmHk_04G010160 [Glycine max]|nr:hypothetical protein GmHk_04G010160 [Glycine max]
MASSSQQPNPPMGQQETSTNMERSAPLSTSTVMTQREGGFELILIPDHEEECRKVWETQLLIPASINKNICFVGPYHPQVDLESIKSWFPTHDGELPINHKDTIMSDFLKEKSCIFKAFPPKDRKTYFSWLKPLETKKAQHWKNIGIYNLIQLSKYDVVNLDMPMLMAYFLFWNQSLHALELPCGLISPTLMDMTTITKTSKKDLCSRSEVKIDFSAKSYGGFIEKNAKDTEEVSDEKHTTFLIDILTGIEHKIEETQLTYLTHSKEFCTYECYRKYIKAFLNFNHFDLNLAPFLNSKLTRQS